MAEKKASAGHYKKLILGLILVGPAFLLVFFSTRGCEHKFKELDDMGEIPAYSFSDQHGKKYTNQSFKGDMILFTTIQLTCPDSCATSMWHLDQLIYQHLRKNKKKLNHVKIVSFLTDGEGKALNQLKLMNEILAEQVEEFDPKLWLIVEGDAKSVYNISRNGENLLEKGDKYFGNEAFQEIMLLADKENHLRMVLKGNSEGMIRRMKQHMALLDKQYDKEAAKKLKK